MSINVDITLFEILTFITRHAWFRTRYICATQKKTVLGQMYTKMSRSEDFFKKYFDGHKSFLLGH